MPVMLTSVIFLSPSATRAQLVIDSLTGPVTAHEINAYKSWIQTIAAPSYGGSNIWVFGTAGKALESAGLMFEASQGDTAILDRMIYYCDAALAGRNDLASAANGGQQVTWTGNIDPVWPSSAQGVTPAQAGVEQGDVLSHMVYCSRLILENPSLWNLTVPIGDPHGYGATYKQRALTYVQQGDYVIDNWILPYFIATADSNHYIFPGPPNTYMAGKPAPWNQAWMLTNAFVRLTQCHVLLADDPARVAKYDSIVQSNINWFRANLRPNTSHLGTPCWIWAYQLPTGVEDTNHAAYDCEGLWIAYFAGRYGLGFNDVLPFANTYFDIVMDTITNGRFAGRVDGTTGTGHAGGDTYVRDEYIYLTEFRPEKYDTVGTVEINTGHIATSTPIVARLLWEKNRRYTASQTPPAGAPINIALNKLTVTSNVYQNNATYNGAKAVDGNVATRWATDNSITSATLEVDLGANYTFNKATTLEYLSRVTSYKVQYWNGTSWLDAFTGTTIGVSQTDSFPSVTGSKVRLNILTVTGTRGPSIYEFEVFGYPAGAMALKNAALAPELAIAPNPVSGSARISYSIKEPGKVSLHLYSASGQAMRTLVNSSLAAGRYEAVLDTSKLPGGSYIVRLTTARGVRSVVMLVTK